MDTLWIYRFYILIAAAHQDAANAFAAGLIGDPPDANNFSIPLSADGTGDPTDYACSIAVTEAIRLAMEPIYISGVLPTLRFYRTDSHDGQLQATTSPTALQHIGLSWTMAYSLQDAGLVVIPPVLD